MKYLILLLLLTPIWAQAQSTDRVCEIERVITKEDGKVTEERRQVCKEKTREIFSDCERYQWNTQWGTHNAVSCNWTESQAMNAALTHATDGVKIEWYDNVRNTKGYTVVTWTRPPTEAGMCRDILRVRKYPGNFEKENFTMCLTRDRGWQSFRGY